MPDEKITAAVWRAIWKLRDTGYAVVVFTPDELRGADPDEVADRMVERGWDVIDVLADEPQAQQET